jgi:hypothetical protein
MRDHMLAGVRRTGTWAIEVPPELYPALHKIIRGLHFHHTGALLPKKCQFSCTVVNDSSSEDFETLNHSSVGVSYSDVFESRYFLLQDHGAVSIWWLRFYTQLSFRCIAETAKQGFFLSIHQH